MSIVLDLSPEQTQLVEAIRDVLADRFPRSRLHGAQGQSGDMDEIPSLAALGWLSLGLSEEDGGAGCSVIEEALLCRELGRHCVTPGVIAGMLAAHAATGGGERDLAAAIADGSARVALGAWRGSRHWLLYDAAGATHAVIPGPDGAELIAMSDLVGVEPGACLDKTVGLHHATVPASGRLRNDPMLAERAQLLVAAYLLGLADGALATAVDYAKLRQQFGQPIGGFQAVKHRCADMKCRVARREAQIAMAALALREQRAEAALQVAAARHLAAPYALENAAACIQIHGGMGFTAECDAHLFLLRAHVMRSIGPQDEDLERQLTGAPLPDFA
jgi:alkylation response protein AidB-like acyl-CoA dehydrogenase